MFDPSPAEVADRDQRRKAFAEIAGIAHDLFTAFLHVGFDGEESLALTMQGLDQGYGDAVRRREM